MKLTMSVSNISAEILQSAPKFQTKKMVADCQTIKSGKCDDPVVGNRKGDHK